MNNEQLEKIGLALFGRRWKAPLARKLGTTRETVSRWSAGRPIPSWAVAHLETLITMQGTVLSLCDRTGYMVQPWADAGFECICVDVQHVGTFERDGVTFVGTDLRDWLPPPRKYVMVFAFPPCTNLASSGARWFADKGIGGLMEGVELVEICRRICEWSEAPWALENPVGTLSSYWRKPNHTFDPCDYAGYLETPNDEAYTKKTCLWTSDDFIMPKRKRVDPVLGSKMHLLPPSETRGDERSITPKGFAYAVMQENSRLNVTKHEK